MTIKIVLAAGESENPRGILLRRSGSESGDLPKGPETRAGSRFTRVNEHHGAAPVFMAQEMVAAADTNYNKAIAAQRCNQVSACNTWVSAHAAMVMR
jgi:hypothetical protein